MSKAINEHIEKKRRQIRKTQINQLFSFKRSLNMPIPKDLAVQTLMPQLSVLKRCALREEGFQELRQSLNRIHHVVLNYDIMSVLVKRVEFQPSQLVINKFGASFNEITWVDLLIVFLKDSEDDSQIRQECSLILSNCALSLKSYCSQKQGRTFQSIYTRQLKRLLQNYPYDLLIQGTIEITQSSLTLIYNLILGCPDGSSVYFLINKIKPNIVSLFNYLTQKEHLLNVDSLNQTFLNTCVTLLYFMDRYNYSIFDFSQYKILVNHTSQLIMGRLLNSKNQEQFLLFCQYVRLILQLKECRIQEGDFWAIQNILQLQQHHLHKQYLLVLKSALYYFTFLLSPSNFKILSLKLFSPNTSQEELSLKCIILDILSSQVANNGGKFTEQEMQIFISCWGEDTQVDRLLCLVQELDNGQFGDKALKNIFELLVRVTTDSPAYLERFIQFLGGELECLLSFPQFKEILELHGFDIVQEESSI